MGWLLTRCALQGLAMLVIGLFLAPHHTAACWKQHTLKLVGWVIELHWVLLASRCYAHEHGALY